MKYISDEMYQLPVRDYQLTGNMCILRNANTSQILQIKH